MEFRKNSTRKIGNLLHKTILSNEEFWQARSAAAVGELRSPEAIEILKALLDSEFTEITIAVASELDWAEAAIEEKYAEQIQKIIDRIPSQEIDPCQELGNLLKK